MRSWETLLSYGPGVEFYSVQKSKQKLQKRVSMLPLVSETVDIDARVDVTTTKL